jgi:hypothetical protein
VLTRLKYEKVTIASNTIIGGETAPNSTPKGNELTRST